MRFFTILFVAGILISLTAQARPVSYPTGWTGMLQNNGDANSAHIHYSPTAKISFGYKYEHWRDAGYDIHALQMNNLLKRWNKRDSQANIYLKSGVGIADDKSASFDSDTNAAGFSGIAIDWEDRRYFTSYENRYTHAGDFGDSFIQSARVGIAPYIGDYGDLHTWLMLEVKHDPEGENPVTVTPLVRLFKDVHLVEAGISNHGDALFNYVLRY